MKSYFFIPAARKEFVENVQRLPSDYFIFDFEDSVNTLKLDEALATVAGLTIKSNFFARFYWNNNDAERSSFYIEKLVEIGFTNFFIPKFHGLAEIAHIYKLLKSFSHFQQFKLALLIENPQSLTEIQNILAEYKPFAIALGSHDYCAEMNMLHTPANISWARNYLLNFAKAASVSSIDVASMNIDDEAKLELEFQEAFNMGFEGKLLIHPKQLEVFQKTTYFTNQELDIALKLRDEIRNIGGLANFTLINIDGTVIEKPHLGRYFRILKMAGYETI